MSVKDNRMFAQMLLAARARLAGRKPQEICKNTNITYNENDGFFFWNLWAGMLKYSIRTLPSHRNWMDGISW